jgi:hypothetical protein
MTPPTPTRAARKAPTPNGPWYRDHGPDMQGVAEEDGPLVRQPAAAARLARILHHSATDLWDVCTLTDSAQMWEEARAIASHILASTPGD